MSFSDSERQGLADLLLKRGPGAPTLCEGWTTTDLAAHLWVREHRPDAILGMFVRPLAGHLDSVSRTVKEQDYRVLVEKWRAGPSKFSPFGLMDSIVNVTENFVHHEDVRRASDGWEVRNLSSPAQETLRKAMPKLASIILRKSSLPVVLNPVGFTPVTVGGARGIVARGTDVVRVTGEVGEIILWVFGREAVDLEIAGDVSKIVRSSF